MREWPFDASTLARFGLYLLIPLGSWAGGALVERLINAILGEPSPPRQRGRPSPHRTSRASTSAAWWSSESGWSCGWRFTLSRPSRRRARA